MRDHGTSLGARFLSQLAADPRRGAAGLARRLERAFDRAQRRRSRGRRLTRLEASLWSSGRVRVAGVDEVGVGCLAGPVVAAAVVFEPGRVPLGVDDSKLLSEAERLSLSREIRDVAMAVATGQASVTEIDQRGIHAAGLLAMRRAALALAPAPDHVLVDARTIPDLPWPQEAHVKGDRRSASIAAASIVAKVERDALMRALDRRHPGYGFADHVGYATSSHREALRRLGASAAHRTSWDAVAELAGGRSRTFTTLRDALAGARTERDLARWQARLVAVAEELGAGELRRLKLLARRRGARGAVETGDRSLPLE